MMPATLMPWLLLATAAQTAPPQPLPPPVTPADPSLSQAQPTQDNEDAEIVVSGARFRHAAGDPFERINAKSFAMTQKVDDAIVGPVARSFDRTTPKPMRQGLRNVLNNLREPIVFANYLLQLKPGKAAETVGRFALNTTLGIGGIVDVAKRCPFNLPWRPNGFSDTLGVYGVKEGPYLFMPLVGPTTLRDIVGGSVDRIVAPIALGGPFKSRPYVIGTNIYRVIDRRAEQDDALRRVRESDDPYGTRRTLFFTRRAAQVARLKEGATVPRAPSHCIAGKALDNGGT